MMPPRRKHPVHLPFVERFNEPSIIFLTVCTQDRKRILASDEVVTLLRDSWQQATSWMVGRFIVMPDHLHLFCAPAENRARPLNQWVRYWKTLASRRWPRPLEQPVWQLDFWTRNCGPGCITTRNGNTCARIPSGPGSRLTPTPGRTRAN